LGTAEINKVLIKRQLTLLFFSHKNTKLIEKSFIQVGIYVVTNMQKLYRQTPIYPPKDA